MTIDKFGRHISKRDIVDISSIENAIFSNVENKIIKKFKSDVKYVETDNFNTRIKENYEELQNIAKKIKLMEDEMKLTMNNMISDTNKLLVDLEKRINLEVKNKLIMFK